mgnify:CR=1 FL=1
MKLTTYEKKHKLKEKGWKAYEQYATEYGGYRVYKNGEYLLEVYYDDDRNVLSDTCAEAATGCVIAGHNYVQQK